MDPAEPLRINTLAKIVGHDAVKKFAFYDDIDYDSLVVSVTATKVGSLLNTLREIRGIAEIPIAAAKQALSNARCLHQIHLVDCPGSIERQSAVTKLQKIKKAIEQHGGSGTIDLKSPDNSFVRTDCSEEELNYVKTRIITWM